MNIFTFLEFFDIAFMRLIWALIVDYLISTGYLLPEQRQIWVEGYMHIFGGVAGIIFVGIWLHHANKLQVLKQLNSDPVAKASFFKKLTNGINAFIFAEKNGATIITGGAAPLQKYDPIKSDI